MDIIDKDKTKNLSPKRVTELDPWEDWKPKWTIENSLAKRKKRPKKPKTPHDFQEQHSPTKATKVKLSDKRSIDQNQRRITDARLWNAMSAPQQDAALQIEFGFRLTTKGIGYRTSDPSRIPNSKTHNNETEHQTAVISSYFDWSITCQKSGLSHTAVIDILAYGLSCRKVDKARRLRNGWARTNLLDCLTLYCKMKGWTA